VGDISPVTAGRGWDDVADEWVKFVRDGSDVLYPGNAAEFIQFLPAPGRLTVDVGCGEGRFDRLLSQAGHKVVGIDGSPSLIRLAAEADPRGDYRVADAGTLPLESGTADLVVSFMALHDIRDLGAALTEARRVLIPGTSLCFAIIHPIASAGAFESAAANARFVVDAYLPEQPHQRPLFGREVTQYHRPLSSYLDALRDAGFVVARLAETAGEQRGAIPMFLHVHAVAQD
jgi:SAM-dependent methyltransferase